MTATAEVCEFTDTNSLLTKRQQKKFGSISYTEKHSLDCVDYDAFNTHRNGEPVVACGYIGPHDDIECGHQECWVIRALHVDEEEEPCLVHILASGEIVANTLTVGKIYSFLYKTMHAVVPKEVAVSMVVEQTFHTERYQEWDRPRREPGYKEGAKFAFSYVDNVAADITQSNLN